MQPFIRQGARLTTRSTVRASRVASPCAYPRTRKLHTDDSGNSRNTTERNERQPENRAHPSDQLRSSNSSSRPDVLAKATDEKSEDATKRHVLRKTLRRQRGLEREETPPPPAIPAWFLKHNVHLRTETLRPGRTARSATVLRWVDNETGHTLFELPYYPLSDEDPPSSKSSDRLINSGTGKFDKKPRAVQRDFFDNKYPHRPLSSLAEEILSTKEQQELPSTSTNTIPEHLKWIYLEIEANLQAAFAASTIHSHTSSRAATDLDLCLQFHQLRPSDAPQAEDFMRSLAASTQSDLVCIDANDLTDLATEYVGQGVDTPGSFATLAHDVVDAQQTNIIDAGVIIGGEEAEDADMEPEPETSTASPAVGVGISHGLPNLSDLRRMLFERRHEIFRALQNANSGSVSIMIPQGEKEQPSSDIDPTHSSQPWDDSRLSQLLEQIIDAAPVKRKLSIDGSMKPRRMDAIPQDAKWDLWADHRAWMSDSSILLTQHMRDIQKKSSPKSQTRVVQDVVQAPSGLPGNMDMPARRTIVHVRNIKHLDSTRVGHAVIRKLSKAIQRLRRAKGVEIALVGSNTVAFSPQLPSSMMQQDTSDRSPFRIINVPAKWPPIMGLNCSTSAAPLTLTQEGETNLRNIQSMLRRLRPSDEIDLFNDPAQEQLRLSGNSSLLQRVLSLHETHCLSLIAMGLTRRSHTPVPIQPLHIALAAAIMDRSRAAFLDWTAWAANTLGATNTSAAQPQKFAERLSVIKSTCDKHESRLLSGVIDPANIRTGFAQVHAPAETIDALRTLTSLSLLRPDAFKYGVLAADRLPGLMLYGPPGTGKTLLARAVAKETKSTMLEISGAQIYEKYVGEGEKMVRAVFSLARKLSPCVVFLDEADAIFGSRGRGGSSGGSRPSHREIINQFLREWDGMDRHDVFVMVASNRPFDFDDAVLRRLPRRLLVDLPVPADRAAILKIHLADERLDASVDIDALAKKTVLYSGSDLKNLCVAAALACVREEMETSTIPAGAIDKPDARSSPMMSSPSSPSAPPHSERRILKQHHFDRALQEISASISEDMSSLTAIRKFDEQYGDRRQKRKKPAYGFGLGGGQDMDGDELAGTQVEVRVRQDGAAAI